MKNLLSRYIIDVANTALMRRTKQVLILRSHLADNIHCQYFPKTRIFSGISAPPPLCLSLSFSKWKIRPELDPNPKSPAFWPSLLLNFCFLFWNFPTSRYIWVLVFVIVIIYVDIRVSIYFWFYISIFLLLLREPSAWIQKSNQSRGAAAGLKIFEDVCKSKNSFSLMGKYVSMLWICFKAFF